jgi:hypothetical protein
MGSGRSGLLYAGAVVAVVGLVMLLVSKASLGFYVGTGVTLIGVVLVGLGLRRRLKEKNPLVGDIVLIGSLVAAAILASVGYLVK